MSDEIKGTAERQIKKVQLRVVVLLSAALNNQSGITTWKGKGNSEILRRLLPTFFYNLGVRFCVRKTNFTGYLSSFTVIPSKPIH